MNNNMKKVNDEKQKCSRPSIPIFPLGHPKTAAEVMNTERLATIKDSKKSNDEPKTCNNNGEIFKLTPRSDPRFQQQNQTLRCYVMYTDFYRCQKILGEKHKACTWFKDVFTSICPKIWIEHWDFLRTHDPSLMLWHRYHTQGDFPGHTYGNE